MNPTGVPPRSISASTSDIHVIKKKKSQYGNYIHDTCFINKSNPAHFVTMFLTLVCTVTQIFIGVCKQLHRPAKKTLLFLFKSAAQFQSDCILNAHTTTPPSIQMHLENHKDMRDWACASNRTAGA